MFEIQEQSVKVSVEKGVTFDMFDGENVVTVRIDADVLDILAGLDARDKPPLLHESYGTVFVEHLSEILRVTREIIGGAHANASGITDDEGFIRPRPINFLPRRH